jgi:hypothetical protein
MSRSATFDPSIPLIYAQEGEPTSGLGPLTPAPATSDDSCVAGVCRTRIPKPFSLLWLSHCCGKLQAG